MTNDDATTHKLCTNINGRGATDRLHRRSGDAEQWLSAGNENMWVGGVQGSVYIYCHVRPPLSSSHPQRTATVLQLPKEYQNDLNHCTTRKMSSLTYSNYEGVGQRLSDKTHYSQAVRLPTTPPTIKTSGQGGWNPSTGEFPDASKPDGIRQQIDLAFANLETTLKAAGSKGWSDVYLVRMFYVIDGERDGEQWKQQVDLVLEAGGEALRKWCPEHRPLLTGVEVRGLAAKGMRVEIEVEALDSE